MEYSKNPFTPTFGSIPPFLAGREHILRDINRGFINGPGDPNLSTIFTGARGTGKTALLSLLSETALEHDWIAANGLRHARHARRYYRANQRSRR